MTTVLELPADGPLVAEESDALDLIAAAWEAEAALIAIPVARLHLSFFDLSSGVAGRLLQKFVNYRLRVAVVGNISGQLAASQPLRDFVTESNRGGQVWFVADRAALNDRLAATG